MWIDIPAVNPSVTKLPTVRVTVVPLNVTALVEAVIEPGVTSPRRTIVVPKWASAFV